MTPHQALALGVRLFAVWFALVTVRELLAFLGTWRSSHDSQALVFLVGGTIVTLAILLVLWFFPKSIARGLLPTSIDVPTQTSSYQMWFSLGVALMGLWFVASAITPILRNVSVMYVFRSELTNLEDMRQLRVGIFYYLVELVIGLCLIVGAAGITRFIWWLRHAGPE